MIPIDIPRRAKTCSKNGEVFMPGHTYMSRLTLIKDRDYQREDFCLDCWTSESEVKGSTLWKGEVPKKTLLEKKSDRLEKGLELLRQCLEADTLDDQKQAYFLALFLQRRKWLISRGEFRRKGVAKWLFEVSSTEELIEIPKVTIGQEDASLQELIAKKFE